ncbi:MAG: TonB-dependent receptor plug domain-containing protein [Thermoanaerobaculaceae bacterium]
MNTIPRTVTVATLMLLLAGGALAQQAPAPATEDFALYTMAEITVSADAPKAEVAQTTTVTAEDIKSQNARTVAEALAATAGIRVSSGRKNEPNVSIHGFDQSKILVLVDGVPYYETNYGKLDLNQIPTDNIARIDVTKGAASVLYGANAMGGVINIITKKASDRPFYGATVEAGENGLRQYVVTHGQKTGKVNYWVSYTHMESDGWDVSDDYEPVEGTISQRSPNKTIKKVLQGKGRRVNSDVDKDAAWFKVGVENGPDSAYWVNLHYLDMTKGMPPATDTVSVFLSKPQFSQFARMPDYRDRGVDVDLKQRLSRNLVLKGKLFHHDHQDNYDSYTDDTYTQKMARSTFKDYLTGGTILLESPFGPKNTARLSLNYKTDSHRERDDTYLPFAETQSYTGSVGIEDEMTLSASTRAVVGVSYDWFDVADAERNVLDKNGNLLRQDALAEPSDSFVNPMLGITHQLSPQSQVFASAARKSRFPLLQHLYSSKNGNIDLEPERSTNYVLGYNTLVADTLRLELSGFWYDISDLISRSGTDPTNLYQNYGKVRMRGIEASAILFASPSLSLRGDYTLNDAEDLSDDRVTRKVINVPREKAGFGLQWKLPAIAARVDLDAVYLSEVFTSLPSPKYPTDPTKKVGSYVLTNARVGVDVLSGLELWAAVRNVFDEDYAPEYGFPGPRRSASIGLSAKL